MIPYGRQEINQQDIDSVVQVLQSDFLTQGPQVPLFEQAIKQAVNADHAIALTSATAGLHLACLALGVGPGDVVWTTPVTFVATANCALYCGANIDFVDIDADTYNLCASKLEQKLLHTRQNNLPLPKVVIPVHLSGQSCDMEKIHCLSLEYGFSIIEDAAHAIGARYQDAPVGNCQYSDICVFSFHPVKIITTGEGGVITTNNTVLAEKMALLRSHGITRDSELLTNTNQGGWYYEQIELGFNYRMTEMQAALGLSQMSRLDDFVLKRNNLARSYDSLLNNLPLLIPKQTASTYSTRHLYIIRLKLEEINLAHRQVFEALRIKGIGVNLHYIPIYQQPFYQTLGFTAEAFIEAERYYQEAISIPLFHGMTDSQQSDVVQALTEVLLCP